MMQRVQPYTETEKPMSYVLRAAWTLMTSDSWEFSLVPTALTALTRKMYCSPVVKPCTTNLRNTVESHKGQALACCFVQLKYASLGPFIKNSHLI